MRVFRKVAWKMLVLLLSICQLDQGMFKKPNKVYNNCSIYLWTRNFTISRRNYTFLTPRQFSGSEHEHQLPQHLLFLSCSYTRVRRQQTQQSSAWLIFCAILDLEHLIMQRSYQRHRALSEEFRIQLNKAPISQKIGKFEH